MTSLRRCPLSQGGSLLDEGGVGGGEVCRGWRGRQDGSGGEESLCGDGEKVYLHMLYH